MNTARRAVRIADRFGVDVNVEQVGGGTEVATVYARGGDTVYVLSHDAPHVALYSTTAWIEGGAHDDVQTYPNYAHAVQAMAQK